MGGRHLHQAPAAHLHGLTPAERTGRAPRPTAGPCSARTVTPWPTPPDTPPADPGLLYGSAAFDHARIAASPFGRRWDNTLAGWETGHDADAIELCEIWTLDPASTAGDPTQTDGAQTDAAATVADFRATFAPVAQRPTGTNSNDHVDLWILPASVASRIRNVSHDAGIFVTRTDLYPAATPGDDLDVVLDLAAAVLAVAASVYATTPQPAELTRCILRDATAAGANPVTWASIAVALGAPDAYDADTIAVLAEQ